jgi:hypothetical protein
MSFMTLTKWIDCSIYWLLLRKEKKKNPKGWNSKSIWSYNPSARGLFLLSFDFLSALFWVSVDPLPFAGCPSQLSPHLVTVLRCQSGVLPLAQFTHRREKVGGERENGERP